MDAPTPLPADADPALALQQRLAPGEPLLWQGAPRQGLLWRSEDWLGVVFSAAWLGIGEILLRDHGDGSGTLRFGDIRPGAGATSELRDTKPLAPAYFDSIPDATVVCERIRSLRGETGSAS